MSARVRFLAAVIGSFYGDWLTTVALSVSLLDITGSVAAPAGYVLARFGPRLAGPAAGGWAADRRSPRAVLAVCLLLQGAVGLATALALAERAVWAVYPLVVAAQLAGSAVRPSHAVLIRHLSSDGRLSHMNALYAAGANSSILVAPALATLLLRVVSAPVLVVIDSVTFLVAVALVTTLPSTPAEPVAPAATPLPAWRIIWDRPPLRAVAAAYVASGVGAAVSLGLLVAAAAGRFGGAENVGWLYAANGVGGVLASLGALRRPRADAGSRRICAVAAVELIAMGGVALAPVLAAAVALVAVYSAATALWTVWATTLMQRIVPREQLGRASGLLVSGLSIGMMAGGAAGLTTAAGWGWAPILGWSCAAGALLVGAAGLLWTRGTGEPAAAEPLAREA